MRARTTLHSCPRLQGRRAVPLLKNTVGRESLADIDQLSLGRGDYAVSEWASALALARERWTEHTAEYLIGTPLLADYLTEGLDQLDTALE